MSVKKGRTSQMADVPGVPHLIRVLSQPQTAGWTAMRPLLALVIAVATSVGWSWIFLRRDKFDPEPRRLLIVLFLGGCAIAIPCGLLEYVLARGNLTGSLVVAPFVEEAFKLGLVWLVCWRSRYFNQLIDGTIYAVSAALGFAAIENFLYSVSGGFAVLGVRVLFGPIGHPLFTGVAGYYLARAKFEGSVWRLGQGFALAVLLHAGWNVGPALFEETGNHLFAGLALFVAAGYALLLLRFLHRLESPDAQKLRGILSSRPRSPGANVEPKT